MNHIETFLNNNGIVYHPLFDTTRGDAALKQSLGISRSYYIDASSVGNPELLRQDFLELTEEVEDCQHNQILDYDQYVPTFPNHSDTQWNLQKIDAADIETLDAWEISRKASPVMVAVIDNFRSLQQRTSANGTDGHGVAVAQIADSENADMLLFNVAFEDSDYAKFDKVFEAIEYAVDEKLDNPNYTDAVINLSLSAPIIALGETQEERERNTKLFQRWIHYAYLSGVPIVTSMGNLNWDMAHYPAAFAETIAVGGIDRFSQRWIEQGTSFGSNTGTHLDLMAVAIDPDGTKTGTSMAAARVTGTMASLLDILALKHPEYVPEKLHQELRWLLETTALDRVGDPIEDTPGHDPYYGRGVIDPDAAAACAEREQILVRPAAVDFGTVKIGDASIFPVMLTNCYKAQTFVIDRTDFSMTSTASEQIDSFEFEIVNHPVTHVLESGETYTFDVRFTPQTTGPRSALLSSFLHSTSPENVTETLDVPLHGTALGAEFTGLVAKPDVLDFGDVRVDGISVMQITLTNFYQTPITIQDMTITEFDAHSGFQVIEQYSDHLLDTGTSLTFKVQFEPQTSGLKHAFVSISTGNSEPYDIPLYGRALDRDVSSEPDPYLPYQPDDEPIPSDPAQLQTQADILMRSGAEQYNQGEFWQALEQFKQAHKLYRIARYSRGEAQALTGIGLAYAGVGRFEHTITAFQEATVIYQHLNDRLQEGIILNKTGMVYSRMGQYIHALHTFHAVLKIEQELNRRLDEGRTHMNIGVIYLNQGWLQRAKPYFDDALAIAQAVHDLEGEGIALINIGDIDSHEEHYPEALNAYRQALELIGQLSQAEIQAATILLKIGDVSVIQTDYSEALQAFEAALTLFRETHDRRGEAIALGKIGDLARIQGNYAETLAKYDEALTICREIHDSRAELDILEQFLEVYKEINNKSKQTEKLSEMGEVYNRLRQYDDALQVLMQAMLIQGAIEDTWDVSNASATSAIGDKQGLSQTFMIIGEVFLRKGEYEKAVQMLDFALNTQSVENGWVDTDRVHTNLAEAYLKQGNTEAAKDELIKINRETGYTLMLRGELLCDEDNDQEALPKLQQAVEIFEVEKRYEEQGRALMEIGEVFYRRGEYSDARDRFQKALMSYRRAYDLKGEALALTRLGKLQEDPAEALRMYRDALELYRTLDDRDGQLEVLHWMLDLQGDQSGNAVAIGLDLGKAYISRGDYEEAINTLQSLDSSSSSLAEQAEILLYLGIAYRLQHNYPEALIALGQALALYSAESASSLKGTILLNIGETHFRQAQETDPPNFDAAMASYHAALALYDQVGDLQGQGTALMRIGDVYIRQENYTGAIQSYNDAVAFLSEVDDHYNQVLALMSLGQAYDSAGLYWDALEAYKRALGILHDTGTFIVTDSFHVRKDVRRALEIINSPAPVNPAEVYQRMAEDYIQTEQYDEAAEALEQAAQSYDLQGEDEEALETYEELQDMQQENSDPAGEADTLEEMADIKQEAGETEEALELLEEALERRRRSSNYAGQEEIVEKIEELDPDYMNYAGNEPPSSPVPATIADPVPQAMTENLQDVRNPAGEFPWDGDFPPVMAPDITPALAEQSPSAPIHTTALRRRAEALNNMGLVYLRQGFFQKASKAFLVAQRIQEATGDQLGRAKTLNNRGAMHYMLGQYDRAEKFFAAARVMMRRVSDRLGEATVLNHLALVYYRQGQEQEAQEQYQMAEILYGKAINIFRSAAAAITEETGERATQGTILNNLGLVYATLMALYRNQGDRETHADIAFAYSKNALDAYQHAFTMFHEALSMVREDGGRAGESATLHNLGKLYAGLRLDNKALRFLRQALTLERETGNYMDEVRTLADIGYIYERQGALLLHRGHEMFLPSPSSLPGEKYAHSALALLKGAFRSQQALEFYKQSLAVRENLRTAAGIEEFKISMAEQSIDVYQQAILLLMKMNQAEEAFNLSERAHARTLLDQLGNIRLDIRNRAHPQLLRQEQGLRAKLSALQKKFREELNKPLLVDNTELIDTLKAQITQRQEQYEELLAQLKVSNPEYASLVSVTPLKLSEIRNLLDDDTTLLSYFVTPEKMLIFVISGTSFETVAVPVDERMLRQAVLETRKPAEKNDPVPESLQALYKWLIEPIESYLNTPTVGIIPHDVLHYLSFAALREAQPHPGDSATPFSQRYFGDAYRLFALPSGSTLQFVQQKQKPAHGNVLAVGNKGYPPLKYAEREAQEIAEIHGALLLLREEATEAAFQKFVRDASIVHVSTHAQLNAVSPLFSGIMLHDGMLEVHEIYGMTLPHTDLAVLSACNTQVSAQFGQQHPGREIVALNRAFIYAGAPSVIASLWSVNDEATYDFMISFHKHLKQGLSKAEALQQARIETRQEYAHPRYWAAFVLTGDPGEETALY